MCRQSDTIGQRRPHASLPSFEHFAPLPYAREATFRRGRWHRHCWSGDAMSVLRCSLFTIILPVAFAGCTFADAGGSSESGTDGLHTATTGAGFTLAYIGDSHSDYFGNRRGAFGFLGQHMTELAQAQAIPLSLFAASGSMPSWWDDG